MPDLDTRPDLVQNLDTRPELGQNLDTRPELCQNLDTRPDFWPINKDKGRLGPKHIRITV